MSVHCLRPNTLPTCALPLWLEPRRDRCADTRPPHARPAPAPTCPPLWLLGWVCIVLLCTALQEITNSYQPGVIHRPDMSLYVYGA